MSSSSGRLFLVTGRFQAGHTVNYRSTAKGANIFWCRLKKWPRNIKYYSCLTIAC